MNTCRDVAARGVPNLKHEIAQLVKDAYGHVPSIAQKFRNVIPGKDWVNSFCLRRNLSLKVPRKQQAIRYRSNNAEVLSAPLTILEKVVQYTTHRCCSSFQYRRDWYDTRSILSWWK